MSLSLHHDLGDGYKVLPATLIPRLPFFWVGPFVFVAELAIILAISVGTGVAYHEIVLGTSGDIESFIAVGASSFFYYAIAFAYRGNYSIANLSAGWRQIREVTAVWSVVFLFLLGVAFLLKIGPNFSRGATIVFFGSSWLFLIAWRLGVARFVTSASAKGAFAEQRVIVLGDPTLLAGSGHIDELRRCGYRPVSILSAIDAQASAAIQDAIAATRNDPGITTIFLALDWQQAERIHELVAELSVIPLPIRLLPDLKLAQFLDKPMIQLGALRSAELQRGPLTVQERCTKRIFDIVLAASAVCTLLPLMVLVAGLIKLDSRGPVFFRQTRSGFNHRPFRIFKFRTLTTLDDGPVIQQVSPNDGRVTRLGRFLRRTSIDELPQLMNVLRGEMSLVGPRPHAVAHNSHYEQLIANYAFRHHVKPGLTGWAQAHGFRGETDVALMKKRVDFDLFYVDNWSLWLDIRIIAKTFLLLLRQPTAY